MIYLHHLVTGLTTAVTLKCRGILSSRLGRQATKPWTEYIITRNSTCIQPCVVNLYLGLASRSSCLRTDYERNLGRDPHCAACVGHRGWVTVESGSPIPAAHNMKAKIADLGGGGSIIRPPERNVLRSSPLLPPKVPWLSQFPDGSRR